MSDLSDAFVLGYGPPQLAAHFGALELLETTREGATGELATRVAGQLQHLPARGAELVSLVWEIENIFGRRHRPPPTPPRSGGEVAAYLAAVAAAAPDDKTRMSYEFGARCGAAEAIVGGAIRVWSLWQVAPEDPRLLARVAALRAVLHAAAGLRSVATESPTMRDDDAEIAQALAAAEVLVGKPAEAAATAKLVELLGTICSAARSLEAAALGTPRVAVRAWADKQLAGNALMQRLVEHRRWTVPVRLDAKLQPSPRVFAFASPGSADDKRVLMAFSDAQALVDRPAFLRTPEEQHYVTIPGTTLFGWLPDEHIDVVVLDPTDDTVSPLTINYPSVMHRTLQARAAETAVDLAAADWSHVDLAAVRDAKYWILVNGSNVQYFLAYDSQKRPFVSLFTSEAALHAHLATATPEERAQNEQMQVNVVSGSALFPTILQLDVAGLMTNPNGPGRSRAFNRAMVERLAGAK